MIVMWGLKSCDTCRKARAWLESEGIGHEVRDVRADGLDPAALASWIDELGREVLVNTRGTTWRGLLAADREGLDDTRAAALIAAHPAMMKRPVFDLGDRRLVGFGTEVRQALKKVS